MTAATRITVDARNDVLRAPNQAFRYAPGGLPGASVGQARLWVLRDGQPIAAPVASGLDDETNTEIVSGDLRAGDAIILSEQRGAAGGRVGPPATRP
jgi:HlyD family secretion protein